MATKKQKPSATAPAPPSAGPSDQSSGVQALVKAKKPRKKDTALSPERMDPLWRLLNERIGGREGLLAAAMASSNPKAADLIPLILDKAHRQWGTKALAKKAGISASEIVDMFRDKKWLESILTIHEELPNVVKDATIDAKASYVPCEACKATGKGEDGSNCYICTGKGSLRRPGDKDKLLFVGEAAGMVGKRAPFQQNNTQINVQGTVSGNSFEDMMRKSTLSIGPKKITGIVEAEVVKEDK